jgi:hypothetical protein
MVRCSLYSSSIEIVRANTLAADIIASVLPEDLMEEVPQGFTQVGHVCMLT